MSAFTRNKTGQAPSLFALARKRLTALHVKDAEALGRKLADEPLRDFIPRITPGHVPPDHLAPMLALLDRVASGEEVRAVVSAPPRHAKTETLLAGIAWMLGRRPELVHGYATYESNLAKAKSRLARSLTQAAGVRFLDDRPGRLAEWHTAAGGGLLATSVGGPFTGQGITGLLVVDDSLKNRLEAESKAKREAQWKWLTDVAYTRLQPGASVIVTMARWHADDLAGRAVRSAGFEHVNLPALDPTGTIPLWAEKRPLAFLLERQRVLGPYSWASLFMGQPRTREGRVFRDVVLCKREDLPATMRIAIGVDLAYTAATRADWSVAVVVGLHAGKVYVLDVVREQLEAPAFAEVLKELVAAYPGVRPRWYAAGTEKAAGQFIRKLGVPLAMLAPRGDKFIRAQPVAAAWNAGNVPIVQEAEWAEGFVERVGEFTGSGGAEVDDEVDALAAGFDVLAPFLDATARPAAPSLPMGGARDVLERDNELGDA